MERRTFISASAAAATTQAVAWPNLAQADDGWTVRQIDAGELNVGYIDAGPRDGKPVVLLHGWPYDIHSYIDVVPVLTARGHRVIVPYLRGYGTTRFLSDATFRNGEQLVFALDTIALMDSLKIDRAIVGGFDWGGRAADIMAALWPERCSGLVSVSGYLIVNLAANQKPLSPQAELAWWYQYYFATDRGRAGYAQNIHDFNKLIWKLASPTWQFSYETYDRTARAFINPDQVAIVIHNYRWRLELAKGDPKLAAMADKLQQIPFIGVPTVTIGSDFDGANATGASYRALFTGKYAHLNLPGIGHNVPQEAPEAFARAVLDLA
jgi:pimeloyl-ACP methyl ester carboxylesterase